MSEGAAAKRSTEGTKPGRRGRPKGSINKAHGLIPKNVGIRLLQHMEAQLSPDQFDYLKGVIRDGKPIETKNEIDTLIALLTRNLYPALIHEMLPENEGGLGGVYRKDVTERLKLVNSMLTLRHQIDKTSSETENDKSNTILTITAKRGINLDRLGILVSQQPDSVDGNANRVRIQADDIRALPNSLPERPLNNESGEQGETDRVLDGDSDGGGVLRDDPTEL